MTHTSAETTKLNHTKKMIKVSTSGYIIKNLKAESQRIMFILMFTVGRSWKQPKCPSTDEWIKKMWYIYTMEYYSAIKRNEIGSFVETWMDLETVIQSEVSQEEENKYRILMHICGT